MGYRCLWKKSPSLCWRHSGCMVRLNRGAAHALAAIAIPTTLHDLSMARLDQLGVAKGTAQLAATIGREFGFALLHAVASVEAETLRRDLRQLVDAELLYQRVSAPRHAQSSSMP